MNYLRMSLIGLFLLFSTVSMVPRETLCQGFVPPNHLHIPVTKVQSGGIDQATFNKVLDNIDAYYRPVMAAKGGNLVINRNWTDDTVNASAERQGSDWVVNMYGGLARHPQMTADGYQLVICHETGHHMGGAPRGGGWFGMSDWASDEGEADYYASLNCLRYMFNDADNATYVATQPIDPALQAKCNSIYASIAERNLCMREGMAGLTAGLVFENLNKDTTPPSFTTPDPTIVGQTNDDHPATQCRVDTYYAGSICLHDIHQELSDSDPNVGTCSLANGSKDGVRPLCWFKP